MSVHSGTPADPCPRPSRPLLGRSAGRLRRSAGRLGALALSLGLGVTMASAVSAPAAADEPVAYAGRQPALPGGNVALTWAPLYMSNHHEYTRAESLRLAKRFDLVAAVPFGLADHSAAMRQANPDLTLLAYSNATLGDAENVRGLPEAAFAHTAGGARIKAPAWNTWLMQPDNAQWRATADKVCREKAALGGFDGCLVDMLTLGIYAQGEATGLPAQPGTNRTWSQAEYRDHMIKLAADLRRRSPDLVQVGNMIENSYRYWESDVSSRPIVSSSPSAQMEDFLRGAHDGAREFPTVAEWRKNVQVITDMESAGKVGLFTTKVWSGGGAALARQWQRYAMASFLMGANGKSFFAFTRSRDKAGASQANGDYAMPNNLGLPQGGMQETASGAFVREFANGAAVVNPTNEPARVDLGRTMSGLGSGTGQSSVVLAPRSGNVFVVGGTPAPFKTSIDTAGKGKPKARTVRAGRWTRVTVKVANPGGKATPRGWLRATGGKVASKKVRVPSLRPGRAKVARVKFRIKARPGRAAVKLVYAAGGKRDVVTIPLKVVGRRR